MWLMASAQHVCVCHFFLPSFFNFLPGCPLFLGEDTMLIGVDMIKMMKVVLSRWARGLVIDVFKLSLANVTLLL
jgi:hypothetical protein